MDTNNPLSVLGAMITPAVLISACANLIVSTSMRLARIVDRVRVLSHEIERLSSDETVDFLEERLAEFERQLGIHTRRGRLIQRALTSFYLSLGLFVATTVLLALVSMVHQREILPVMLGIAGTLFLFYASVLLIIETRLALRSVNSEMQFSLHLRDKYQERRRAAMVATDTQFRAAPTSAVNSSLRKITQKLGLRG